MTFTRSPGLASRTTLSPTSSSLSATLGGSISSPKSSLQPFTSVFAPFLVLAGSPSTSCSATFKYLLPSRMSWLVLVPCRSPVSNPLAKTTRNSLRIASSTSSPSSQGSNSSSTPSTPHWTWPRPMGLPGKSPCPTTFSATCSAASLSL